MKVTLSGMISDLRQTAGGTTIQYSNGGLQLHNRAQQRKKRTPAQRTARMVLEAVTSSWRSLSDSQIAGWNAAAPSEKNGYEFYTSTNMLLATGGFDLIADYTTPVSPPATSYANALLWSYDSGVTPPFEQFFFVSGNNAVPTGDWQPAFLWSGWIAGSRSFFPKMNQVLQVDLDNLTSEGWDILWDGNFGSNPVATGEGYKCQILERWLNVVTGQRYVGSTYIVTYGEIQQIGIDYRVTPQLSSAVLTGSPGSYTLVATFTPLSGSFDSATWSPQFYCGNWGTEDDADNLPYTNILPATAVNIASSSSMIITFSSASGDATPPSTANTWLGIGFNWKNTSTSVISNDSLNQIQAANYT